MQGSPLGFRQRLSVLADVVKHELLINIGHLRPVLHNNILSEPDFFPLVFFIHIKCYKSNAGRGEAGFLDDV